MPIEWLVLVFALLLAGLLALVLFARWTAYVLLLRLLGRAPSCPWSTLLALHFRMRRREKKRRKIEARTELAQTDYPAGLILWNTPDGPYWMPDRPLSRGALADMIAEQDFDQYRDANVGVHAGDVVLDCGANVGVFTRRALESRAALVVAFEPSPATAECLRRNFAAEIAAGRVRVYEGGVWSRDDVLTMNIGDSPAGDSIVDLHRRDVRAGSDVSVTTIDRIVRDFDLPSVDFIKMDIEGAEREALVGGMETLRRFLPRLALSVYHLPDDPAVLTRLVESVAAPYRMSCTACVLHFRGYRHSTASPEVYFFRIDPAAAARTSRAHA